MSDIEAKIVAALESRRSQQEFVKRLVAAWSSLTQSHSALVTAVQDARRSLADARIGPDDRGRLDALLADVATRASRSSDGLTQRLRSLGEQLAAIERRVHRDTVNIAVIGMTRSGKSTLLRAVSGLGPDVIPSGEFDPTTAAPSRIFHSQGEQSATAFLHTWESFRSQVLDPLHRGAGMDQAPPTIAAFASARYPDPRTVGLEHRVAAERLKRAHDSLPSYRGLLTGGTLDLSIAQLRPYVAYPMDKLSTDRRHHAVREVHIRTSFPSIGVARLGLIDMPGAGEAGLDVERQFVQPLRNEVDIFVMVKRPLEDSSFFDAADEEVVKLANSARLSVELRDFLHVVMNDDEHLDRRRFVENALSDFRSHATLDGVRVLRVNAARPDAVVGALLEPVLTHLASRLAEMDRAAVGAGIEAALETAREIAALAKDADHAASECRSRLPEREDLLRSHITELRKAIATDLAPLTDEYSTVAEREDADPFMQRAITAAAGQMRDWVAGGFGTGNRTAWLEAHSKDFLIAELHPIENEYVRTRAKITELCGSIDASVEGSVDELWRRTAEILRRHLGESLVPPGPDALSVLAGTAERSKATMLASALTDLAQVRIGYGSIVLRVTRPIIRTIHWQSRASSRSADGAPRIDMLAGVPAAPGLVGDLKGAIGDRASSFFGTDATRQGTSGGSDRVARVPSSFQAAPAAGRTGQARQSAGDLYDELTTKVNRRVDALEQALTAEARTMARVLSAAADQFYELALQTVGIEWDYEKVCRPYQRLLWPEMFQGGDETFSAQLAEVARFAEGVLSAADQLHQLSDARRLPGLGER